MVDRVPAVSLLCPSRGRPELLEESILSLYEGDWEFLVAVDEDDPRLESYYELQDKLGFVLITTPRYGYAFLERYYNDLAKISSGKWLLLWNDDAEMKQPNWIGKIDKSHKRPYVLQFGTDHCFPMISRTLYNIMGHFSLGPSNDTYLLGVGDRANIREEIPGDFIHHKRDYIHDQTEGDKVQATTNTSNRMKSVECIINQEEDARKVLEWLQLNRNLL